MKTTSKVCILATMDAYNYEMFTQVHTMYLDRFRILILHHYMHWKVIESFQKSLLCMFVALYAYK